MVWSLLNVRAMNNFQSCWDGATASWVYTSANSRTLARQSWEVNPGPLFWSLILYHLSHRGSYNKGCKAYI